MQSCEKLLEGFEADFDFKPLPPLPKEEFEERVRRIRVDANDNECDALILHADMVGWYHTSNSYLRYVCDWEKEGILILPTDEDKPSTLLSFFSNLILWPPPGEPTWVDDIRQIGLWGRKWNRPGDTTIKMGEATKKVIEELGLNEGKLGLIGDPTSKPFWGTLREMVPRASFQNENRIINKIQHIKSKREQELIRAAAQLIDIGVQAACYVCKPGVTDHELYAAFTYAQMSRGGESGDGYQIGINRYGTLISKPYGHIVKPGDIVILYISGVTYRGYSAQCSRMIAVGDITREQEEIIGMCVESIERAMKVVGRGVRVQEVSNAAFQPYIQRGYLKAPDVKKMSLLNFFGPNLDGTPCPILVEHAEDEDWERMGRDLRHVYPPHPGQEGMGHSIGMPKLHSFWITPNNNMTLEPGMTFVLHAQWFEPKKAGCNLGNSLLVTEDGMENLNNHSALEPYRIKV